MRRLKKIFKDFITSSVENYANHKSLDKNWLHNWLKVQWTQNMVPVYLMNVVIRKLKPTEQ